MVLEVESLVRLDVQVSMMLMGLCARHARTANIKLGIARHCWAAFLWR